MFTTLVVGGGTFGYYCLGSRRQIHGPSHKDIDSIDVDEESTEADASIKNVKARALEESKLV